MDEEALRRALEEKDWVLRKTDSALKALYGELEKTNASLEGKVRERTRQLEAVNHRLSEELRLRQEAEQRLTEYSERLEQRVEERTRQLAEAQERVLRQERLALLGKLAGGIGHELRTPLGAIRNAAYFLGMAIEDPDPETRDALDILEKEVRSSSRIIDSLLDFAREKHRPHVPVDLNELLREALERVAIPESVSVIGPENSSLPRIPGDREQLSRAFENLVRNALEAMPDGGRLEVRARCPGASVLEVAVRDTGKGIPEGEREEIFAPLVSTKSRGVGLGLALVRMIAEAHGGAAAVESEEGTGSTFRMTFPLKPGEKAREHR